MHKNTAPWLIFAALLNSSIAFAQPSFKCSRASAETEIRICEVEELQALDRQMAKNFKAIKKIDRLSKPARKELIRTQKIWLLLRNKCATNDLCIAKSYRQRRNTICSEYQPPPVSGAFRDICEWTD